MTVREEQDALFSETPHSSWDPYAGEQPSSPGRLRRAVPVLAISGFYAWNPGPDQIEAGALTFEALDASGQPAFGHLCLSLYPLSVSGHMDKAGRSG